MKTIYSFLILFFISCQIYSQSKYNDYKAEEKKIAFSDEFDNNDNEWEYKQTSECELKIKDGHLFFEVFKNKGSTKKKTNTIFIDEKKDFEMEVSVKIGKVEKKSFQFCWGDDDLSRYALIITTDDKYKISKYDDSRPSGKKFVDYIPWKKTDLINYKKFNKFTVRKVGDEYFFFINETFIYSLPFQSFFGNKIGFVVSEEEKVEVDYLKISYLNSK